MTSFFLKVSSCGDGSGTGTENKINVLWINKSLVCIVSH